MQKKKKKGGGERARERKDRFCIHFLTNHSLHLPEFKVCSLLMPNVPVSQNWTVSGRGREAYWRVETKSSTCILNTTQIIAVKWLVGQGKSNVSLWSTATFKQAEESKAMLQAFANFKKVRGGYSKRERKRRHTQRIQLKNIAYIETKYCMPAKVSV